MITAQNLTKTFDKFTALENLSCSIPNGCIYGLVGSNGAGKSTLLRLITGIYRPDKGEVLIDGKAAENFASAAAGSSIAYLSDVLEEGNHTVVVRSKERFGLTAVALWEQ